MNETYFCEDCGNTIITKAIPTFLNMYCPVCKCIKHFIKNIIKKGLS